MLFSPLCRLLIVPKDVLLDGIFTHFACADEENPESTEEQFTVFMEFGADIAGKTTTCSCIE